MHFLQPGFTSDGIQAKRGLIWTTPSSQEVNTWKKTVTGNTGGMPYPACPVPASTSQQWALLPYTACQSPRDLQQKAVGLLGHRSPCHAVHFTEPLSAPPPRFPDLLKDMFQVADLMNRKTRGRPSGLQARGSRMQVMQLCVPRHISTQRQIPLYLRPTHRTLLRLPDVTVPPTPAPGTSPRPSCCSDARSCHRTLRDL